MAVSDLPRDLPRAELMDEADAVLVLYAARGVPAKVYFKFTCASCGERCMLAEPNVLHEQGECQCGHVTTINQGGFALVADLLQGRV